MDTRDRVPVAIDLLSPAEFAVNTVELNPAAAHRAVGEIAERVRATWEEPHRR